MDGKSQPSNKLEELNSALATTHINVLAMLVKEMRDTQKRYFKTRDHGVLNESKSIERQVDSAVDKILSPQGKML